MKAEIACLSSETFQATSRGPILCGAGIRLALTQRQILAREQPNKTSRVGRRTKLLADNESRSNGMWVFDPLVLFDFGLIAREF